MMTVRLAMLAAAFVIAFGADAAAEQWNPEGQGFDAACVRRTIPTMGYEGHLVVLNSKDRDSVGLGFYPALLHCRRDRPSQPADTGGYNDIQTSFPAPEPSWGAAASALGSALANAFSGPATAPARPSYNAASAPVPRHNPRPVFSAQEIAEHEEMLLERARLRRAGALRERVDGLRSGAPSYAESAVSSSRNSYLEGLEREKLRLEVKLARLRLEALKGARADHSARSEPWHVETAFPVSSREAEQPWAEDDSLARAGAAVTDSLADVGAAVTGAFTDEGFSVSDAWDSWREATTPESMEGYAHKQLMGALPFAAAAGLAAGAITASPVVATVAAGMGAVAVGNGLKNIVDEGMARIKEGLRQ